MAENRGDVKDEEIAAGAVVNVAEYLKGIHFPAKRDDVERVALDNGADPSVIEEIRYLPDDREFGSPTELFAALGQEVKDVLK